MGSKLSEDETNEMEYRIETELSKRELLSIGEIVALWGSLEYEIFCQTLSSFSEGEISSGRLPKAMNNMQFSDVLAAWETQVVNKAAGKRKEVLQKQCEAIRYHHDFRNALVHGMWDWNIEAPEKISAIRVWKKEIRKTHFTADGLASFALALATINFKIRFPGGLADYANAMTSRGAYLSRRAVSAMASHPLTDELFRPFLFEPDKAPQE